MRKPYPLDWPPGQPRTPKTARQSSRFNAVSPVVAATDIQRRLKLMKCSDVVITTNLPYSSKKGTPYADGRKAEDPGVAVWWRRRNVTMVIACDCWQRTGENLRAVASTLEALAGVERWGASQVVERAFAGFAALPAAIELPAAKTWRDVLFPDGVPAPSPTFTGASDLYTDAKIAYRLAMQTAHPDKGGNTDAAAELTRAWAECQAELDPNGKGATRDSSG